VSGSVIRAGGMLVAGVVLVAFTSSAGAEDTCSCFAFFRRSPPDAGIRVPIWDHARQLCRPPRCPPYCDPTFGYYPTAWRSWPTLCTDFGEEIPASTGPATTPGAAPTGPAPRPMPPPATDGDARRLPNKSGSLSAGVPSAGQLPRLSGANAR
jgi:hypothetical protein